MKAHLREEDVLARYGGDEFVIILPGADKKEAYAIGERLRTAIKSASSPQRKLTVSIGVASFPEDADSPSGLIQAADDALRRAKKEGRDAVVVASPSQPCQEINSREGQTACSSA